MTRGSNSPKQFDDPQAIVVHTRSDSTGRWYNRDLQRHDVQEAVHTHGPQSCAKQRSNALLHLLIWGQRGSGTVGQLFQAVL